MSLLCYIPARGGSKRVPRKNIRLLGEKPVLVHVIEALKKLDFVPAICVSTDDAEIAEISKRAGATVLGPRPPELSNNQASFQDLLQQDVPRFLAHFGVEPSHATILFVVATACLVTPGVYRQAYEAFLRDRPPILMAATRYSISPFWAMTKIGQGRWAPMFPDKIGMCTQDFPDTCSDAGLFYYLDFSVMIQSPKHWFLCPGGVARFLVPESMAVDLDTPEDWKRLEQNYRSLQEGRRET